MDNQEVVSSNVKEVPEVGNVSAETPSQNSKLPIIIGAICLVVILILGGLYFYHKFNKGQLTSKSPQTVQTKPTVLGQPTPIISPVTASNVDQTLHNTDTAVQQSINQANTDLNKINNINQSQDSTNGL